MGAQQAAAVWVEEIIVDAFEADAGLAGSEHLRGRVIPAADRYQPATVAQLFEYDGWLEDGWIRLRLEK
jgi:hypothetical protein